MAATEPIVAVIAVVPAVTPEATPFALTVATAGLLELHVASWLASTFPPASFWTIVNCTPAEPTLVVATPGLSVTDATAGSVVPAAMFESGPSTSLTLNVPANATSWTLNCVAGARPYTVHVSLPGLPVPASGDAHVP